MVNTRQDKTRGKEKKEKEGGEHARPDTANNRYLFWQRCWFISCRPSIPSSRPPHPSSPRCFSQNESRPSSGNKIENNSSQLYHPTINPLWLVICNSDWPLQISSMTSTLPCLLVTLGLIERNPSIVCRSLSIPFRIECFEKYSRVWPFNQVQARSERVTQSKSASLCNSYSIQRSMQVNAVFTQLNSTRLTKVQSNRTARSIQTALCCLYFWSSNSCSLARSLASKCNCILANLEKEREPRHRRSVGWLNGNCDYIL